MYDRERHVIEQITARSRISSQIYRQVNDKLENTGWEDDQKLHLESLYDPQAPHAEMQAFEQFATIMDFNNTHSRRSSWRSSSSGLQWEFPLQPAGGLQSTSCLLNSDSSSPS